MNYANLNPEKALIWRILHRDNLPWVLLHGVHCGNSPIRSPRWVNIGNAELIGKRAAHPVPAPPGGTLGDYVPFYFTPFSVMLRNVQTGWNGIRQVPNADIVILVHRHVPLAALLGIVCHADTVRTDIEGRMQDVGVALPVHARPHWYFR